MYGFSLLFWRSREVSYANAIFLNLVQLLKIVTATLSAFSHIILITHYIFLSSLIWFTLVRIKYTSIHA
jgi:hypothetical protein